MAKRCFLFGVVLLVRFVLVGWLVFFFLHFEVLMVLWFVFWVLGKVANVLKSIFPSFGDFLGWLILVYLGLEGLGSLGPTSR